MRRGVVSCLVAGIACLSAWADAPRARQSDRRDRMFPELVVESEGRRATCDALAFTGDGKHLLAVGDDKVVRVWDWQSDRINPESMQVLRWAVWREQRGAIYAMAVSPDREGRRVAIGGLGVKTTAAALMDRGTGEILATVYANPQDHPAVPKGSFGSVRAITFSPRGERIAFGSADGSVWLWHPEKKGTEELKWLGAHSRAKDGFNRVRLLHFLNEEKLLSMAQNGEVFKWDLAADKPEPGRLTVFDDVGGRIHDVILSRDGKWLAARAMNQPRIYVRSLDGSQRKDIALEEKTVASSLAFDARGRLAASIRSGLKNKEQFFLESNDEIRFYDLSDEQVHASKGPPHSGRIDVLAFHPDGKQLAAAGGNDHEVTLWDLSRPQQRPTVLCGAGRGIWNVALSASGRYLAFQTQRDPEPTHPNRRGRGPWTIFDLKRLNWPNLDKFAASPKAETTPDGWQVKPTKDPYLWYVEQEGTAIQHKLPWDKDRQQFPRCYTFLPRAEGQPVRLAVGHYNGVSVFEVTAEKVRRIWLGMGHEGEVMSLAASAKGDWLVSSSDDQTIAAWSLTDWPCGSELGAHLRNEDGRIIVTKVDLFSPAWESGLVAKDEVVQLTIERDLTFRSPNADGQGSPVGSVEACLNALATPEPGKPLIFRVKRGRAEWIDMFTTVRRRPLWRFFPTRNKEWILWMGGHPYYDTSNNGDKYIGWQMNNPDDVRKTPKFYPAEQFRKLFHKPAVIDKLVTERDIRQALEESGAGLKPPNFDKLFDAVSLRIEPRQKQVKDEDVQVILDIQSRPENPDYAPMRAELWVNDHRLMVWPREGEDFSKTWPKTCTIERKHLRAGDNDLVLQCYNRVESRGEGRLEASASVRCDRKLLQRNLHGLVVGINDYSQAAPAKSGERLLRDLNTPLDDMEAIRKAWMNQQGGHLYAKVDIVFLNEKRGKVDRTTILKALRGLAEKAGPDDQVFVFLAGHGTVLDPEGKRNFVFCCPDFDPHNPKTSINSRELYEALADIRCRKVVFLDVCHSGEVVRPVRDLTPGGRGPTILAACDSGESSWEPLEAKGAPALNQKKGTATPGADRKPHDAKGTMAVSHSFFVAALLEAFGDRFPRADLDGDGRLDAREIFEYTSNRVPELLKDAKLNETQTPTCFPRRLGRNALLARSSPSGK